MSNKGIGCLSSFALLMLVGLSVTYWRFTLPILAVIVILAVIGGRAKAREAELDRQARVRAALEAAHQWAVDQEVIDNNKKVVRELQAQVDQAKLRNQITALDNEYARLNQEGE